MTRVSFALAGLTLALYACVVANAQSAYDSSYSFDNANMAPIADQQQCGSCYAYTVAHVVQDSWAKLQGGKSEIAPWSPACGDFNQPNANPPSQRDGCQGGDPYTTSYYYGYNIGFAAPTCPTQPPGWYSGSGVENWLNTNSKGCDKSCTRTFVDDATQWSSPTPSNIPAIKSFLVQKGSMGLSVEFTTGGWHAMRFTGWKTENNKVVWKVANSWGTSAGNNGYYWLKCKESGWSTGTFYGGSETHGIKQCADFWGVTTLSTGGATSGRNTGDVNTRARPSRTGSPGPLVSYRAGAPQVISDPSQVAALSSMPLYQNVMTATIDELAKSDEEDDVEKSSVSLKNVTIQVVNGFNTEVWLNAKTVDGKEELVHAKVPTDTNYAVKVVTIEKVVVIHKNHHMELGIALGIAVCALIALIIVGTVVYRRHKRTINSRAMMIAARVRNVRGEADAPAESGTELAAREGIEQAEFRDRAVTSV